MINTVLWAGQRALLVECDSLADALSFSAHIAEAPLAGQRETIAAARTVLVSFAHRAAAQAAVKQIKRIRPKARREATVEEVVIDVTYDGEDLERAAESVGMSAEALIDWHTSTPWTAAFAGFAPGFLYCVPEDEAVRRRRSKRNSPHPQFSRLTEPRTQVPAGAVAVAAGFSSVYPRASPGGWQLIGSTQAQMWDSQLSHPAKIRPHDTVRYRQVTEKIRVAESELIESQLAETELAESEQTGAAHPRRLAESQGVLEVIRTGAQTLVQDLGRRGFAAMGVPGSGAADAAALRQANQLVGNDESAAGFEILLGGAEILAHETVVMAVTGAETPLEILSPPAQQRSNMATAAGTYDGELNEEQFSVREVPVRAPFWLFPGERLRQGAAEAGLRSYVAVSGGLEAPQVLGSRSTDLLSGLGPEPVQAGEKFALVGATSRFVGIADVSRGALPQQEGPTQLRFTMGPREDWFAASRGDNPGLRALQRTRWTVSESSNRVGLRLVSPQEQDRLQRTRDEELPSEPMVEGAIQVPPSGEPVVFLADHPVTGGYPVIGVLVRADRGLAAQLPPGAEVELVAVDPDTLQPPR